MLIASPSLRDPNFHRTVVLMVEHSPTGAVGLILNRITEYSVAQVCKHLPEANGHDQKIFQGGPVQTDHLLALHREESLGGQRVVAEVCLVGGIDDLRQLLTTAAPEAYRCYAGYAGWGEGQLEHELEAEGWITCDADAHLVFDVASESLWSEALRKKGGLYCITAQLPQHPELN